MVLNAIPSALVRAYVCALVVTGLKRASFNNNRSAAAASSPPPAHPKHTRALALTHTHTHTGQKKQSHRGVPVPVLLP